MWTAAPADELPVDDQAQHRGVEDGAQNQCKDDTYPWEGLSLGVVLDCSEWAGPSSGT